jgi:hypothetical protein
MMKIKATGVLIMKEDALILCFPKKMFSDSVNIASSSFSQYFRIEINEMSNMFLFQTWVKSTNILKNGVGAEL